MSAKLLIDIPIVNWAYSLTLDETKEYTFGTANGNAVTLPSGSASLRHAVVLHKDGWLIQDCGSETGTFVNNQQVSEQRLNDRDILKVGRCEAVFQNPKAAVRHQEWDQTNRIMQQRQSALQSVTSKVQSGALAQAEFEESVVGRKSGITAIGAETSIADAAAGKAQQLSPSDLVWVAQKLSEIVSGVMSKPGSREESYAEMLRTLRETVGGDNGFVMIPNAEKTRWVIRAWVGDTASWTQYEKTHPLPLTVTNRAFQTTSVVSNALATSGDDPLNSASMRALNVNGYIAVPLVEGSERRGVLYFDTRNQEKKFQRRDVKLLEMAGSCILQIENQQN